VVPVVSTSKIHPSRMFLSIVVTALLVVAIPASAQSPIKVFRIGILSLGMGPDPNTDDALVQRLRDLGYVEGRNLLVERRYASAKAERLDALATELAQLKVDVIVAWPLPCTRAAQRATRTISIVFPISGDPVGFGLVASLARPGGNLTGLSAQGADFYAKLVELLKEVVPRMNRVAFLLEPGAWNTVPWITSATRALRVQYQLVEWQGPEDLERAFAAVADGRADALVALEAVQTFTHRRRIVELATARRLPTMFVWREYVDLGGLMAYGPNLSDMFRHSATYVDKILKGAKAEDLPVEQPTRFDLSINLRTAKALGLTVPNSILIRATTVLE
jgi:putative ABC transport system substrate-binding protein